MRSPLRRRLWIALWMIVLIFAGGITIGWMLANAEPIYWKPIDAADPIVKQRAQNIENNLTSFATRIRTEDETWEIELTDDHINEWLAARLRPWAKNQEIAAEELDRLGPILVHVSEDAIHLAMKMEAIGSERVIELTYRVSEDSPAEGPVKLTLTGIALGRLPIPHGKAIEMLEEMLSDQKDSMEILKIIVNPPLKFPVGEKRYAVVTQIRLSEGMMLLTCRTERGADIQAR